MIIFNWRAIDRAAQHDPAKMLKLWQSRNHRCFALSHNRDSYLLNYKDLIDNKIGVSPLEIYHYIRLAAKRNLAEYRLQGSSTLHIAMVDIAIDNFTIIKQVNNMITFKYEELYACNTR